MKNNVHRVNLKSQKGASLIMGLFILMVLLALAGLIIDGGRVILTFNQLFHSTYIAAEADLASYDRELWRKEKIVRFDIPLAEEIICEVLSFNMEEAEIVSITAISSNAMEVKTKAEIPLVFMQWIDDDKWTVRSEAETFIIN